MGKRRWILWQGLLTPSMERFIASASDVGIRAQRADPPGARGRAVCSSLQDPGRPELVHPRGRGRDWEWGQPEPPPIH